MTWIIAILAALVLIPLGVLLLRSPGSPAPLLDENGQPLPGSLSEKVFLEVNGVQQGMFIQSKDVSQPVLLYVHGGMPDYFLTEQYPTGLEDTFTVVWWEQRGSGLSYHEDLPAESKTMEQLIDDTITLSQLLRERFQQDKIYLMGHSGGTFIAIQAAARAPELYHAYIGVAQMSDQLESERLAYTYMLDAYRQQGNESMLRALEAAPVSRESGTPLAYLRLRDKAMHELGIGTTRDMSSIVSGIFLPSLMKRDYTLQEKLNMWRGKASSGVSMLWDTMIRTDLAQTLPALEIPVYFFAGRYDYTCSSVLAASYFERLQAPLKGFYWFEESAHSPLFEEPQKMNQILRTDVLNASNSLADLR